MEEKNKKKMCWNCEGNIAFDEQICPYCRASTIPSIDETEGTPAEEHASAADPGSKVALTMALLMGGTFFFLFGSLLFLFSEGGYFVLRFSDGHWYLYFLAALPMLYFGVRNLIELPEEPIACKQESKSNKSDPPLF